MKRICSALSVILYIGVSLFAGDFVPADGDVVRMTGIEWIDVPFPDSDNPFDKKLPLIDLTKVEKFDNFEISYSFLSDTVFCEQRPDSRREFLLTGDSLRLMTTEAYDVIIREVTPPVWMSFPLTSEKFSESESERKVVRYQRDHYRGSGKVGHGFVGKCDVIMCNGDTLRNVDIHSTYLVHRYTLPRLNEYPDSLGGVDSTAMYVEEINSWYHPASRYPLIQSWSLNVSVKGMNLFSSRSSAALVTEDLPFDPDRTDGTDNRTESITASTGCGYNPDCLTVDASGPDLDIRYKADGDIEIEMILTDIMGHVFASMPRRTLGSGEVYDFHVNRSILPPGDYILYINSGSGSYTEKIPLR